MKLHILFPVSLLCLSAYGTASGQTAATVPPVDSGIMQPSPIFSSENGDTANSGDTSCQKLKREIEASKGRPQHRSTMIELYNAECKDRLLQE